jgi:hypothetical protein
VHSLKELSLDNLLLDGLLDYNGLIHTIASRRTITMAELPPVLFLSHGTTMMLGENSRVRDYWRKLGDDALRHGVKGVVIMVSVNVSPEVTTAGVGH